MLLFPFVFSQETRCEATSGGLISLHTCRTPLVPIPDAQEFGDAKPSGVQVHDL